MPVDHPLSSQAVPALRGNCPTCGFTEKSTICLICLPIESAEGPMDVRQWLAKDWIRGLVKSNIAIEVWGHFKIHRGRSGLIVGPEPASSYAILPGGIRVSNKPARNAVDIACRIVPSVTVHQVTLTLR